MRETTSASPVARETLSLFYEAVRLSKLVLERVERTEDWSDDLEGDGPHVLAAGTSTDGRIIALLTDGTRWNVDERRQLVPLALTLPSGGTLSYGQYGLATEADPLLQSDQIAVTPDLRWMITRSEDNKVCAIDCDSGTILHTLGEGVDELRAAAITSNGRFAVTSSTDRAIDAWDVRAGARVGRLTLDFPILALAITPDGRTIAAADDQGTVFFFAFEKRRVRGA